MPERPNEPPSDCPCVRCGERGAYEVARDRWICDACLAAVMGES